MTKQLTTSEIVYATDGDRERWDHYVRKHHDSSLYHLFEWGNIIHRTYGHDRYYLMATRPATGHGAEQSGISSSETVGILPLIHLKSAIFGNCLVSMPFLDGGGVLADRSDVEEDLLSEAVALGTRIGASRLEIRCDTAIASCDEGSGIGASCRFGPFAIAKQSNKVRMLLNLPESPKELFKSFKSKLRSQINKPLREGCTTSTGGAELLDDFYRVFLVNMRDLGSPIHSKALVNQVLETFPERSRIVAVYMSGVPVAAALVAGFNNVLRNPWASSDRRFSSISPNMLLYLRMLEFGCENGYRIFDFGRSTPGEGTYRFKEQWGAASAPLNWYVMFLDGKVSDPNVATSKRFQLAARLWRRLPLAVTGFIGPWIRKQISL